MTSLLALQRKRLEEIKAQTEVIKITLIEWLRKVIDGQMIVNGVVPFLNISRDSNDLIMLMNEINSNSEITRIKLRIKGEGLITLISTKIDTVSDMVTYKLY